MSGPNELKLTRNAEILKAFYAGESQVAIARRLGISKERVGQILRKHHLRSQRTRAEVDEQAAPFLTATPEHPRCLICKGPIRKGLLFCETCRIKLSKVRKAATRFRSYKKTGRRVTLANALQVVKKFGLTPEDFELS